MLSPLPSPFFPLVLPGVPVADGGLHVDMLGRIGDNVSLVSDVATFGSLGVWCLRDLVLLFLLGLRINLSQFTLTNSFIIWPRLVQAHAIFP